MKKFLSVCIVMIMAISGVFAQRADIRKAAERYKTVKSLTTAVTQTRHNEALTEDVVSKGNFYYRKSNTYSMVFKESKEMLLAKGNTFTMVRNGKARTAEAKGLGNNPFETLRDVFAAILENDSKQLSDVAEVKMEVQGNLCTVTITPVFKDAKVKKRAMFSSCVATVDLKNAELRKLRINEKGRNYTQYDFSNYQLNADFSASVFETNSVLSK
jgi:outer membrane lipoprotein-sorting protein